MRVTTLQTTNTMMNYIQNTESKYYKLAEEASSGLKVTEPSDDPIGVKSLLNTNNKLSQLNGYIFNMETSQSELDTVDSTLESLTDLVARASDYATQAANGTYNADDLLSIKSQIDSIMEGTVNLANTNFNGTYVFSGTATSAQTYTLTKDAITGEITSVTYNGTTSNDYQRYTTISDGISVATNAKGSDVFGSYTAATAGPPPTPASGSGLLYTLGTLSAALGTNPQTAGSTAAINSSITNLDADLDTITATRTKLASVSNRFEMTTSSINETIINLKSYKSDLEDADLSQVLTDLTASKSALQATYSVTSQMLSGKSLLDYI